MRYFLDFLYTKSDNSNNPYVDSLNRRIYLLKIKILNHQYDFSTKPKYKNINKNQQMLHLFKNK